MTTKQPSQRQRRVAEQIRGIVSQTLHRGHFHDPVLIDHAADITVGHVDISPDLKNARVYVMSLGGRDLESLLPLLNKTAPYFQAELNRAMTTKFTPRIQFVEDKSFADAERINRLLSTLK